MACVGGQYLTDKFSEIGNAVEQIDWYLLPIQIQRVLPAIIMFSQEPIIIKFFGNLACSREQLKKVCEDL